ncbi:hypothetical protein ACQCVE_17175 [Metabacillus sp. 113a]|uniref:hypothetical protein n=1 Tax=Metabacillus sp. 113a TaxID=3404706 RepID=UPI003CF761E2
MSTGKTRDKIAESFSLKTNEEQKTSLEAYIQQTEKRIETEKDRQLLHDLTMDAAVKRMLKGAMDILEPSLPTMMIEDRLVLECSERKVELHCFGGGHTDSDLFMYLPEEKVLFAGDLVLVIPNTG